MKNIYLRNRTENIICSSKYMQILGQIYSSGGRKMPLELLPCRRSNIPQSAMAGQCFITFFLKAFHRREQTVFFSNQDQMSSANAFNILDLAMSAVASSAAQQEWICRAEQFVLRPKSPCNVICTLETGACWFGLSFI